MKKILIISDGSTGKHFVDRVIQTYTSENIYYVVETKAVEHEEYNPARFKFYEFDPTSLHKLANLLKMDFVQVIILMNDENEAKYTLKNIRSLKNKVRIILLDNWGIENTDPDTVLVNSNEIVASRLIDYLPNVPVIAQNVGIGEGEIMEVLVPFGSSFVYRHIGVIEQKDWRIVAIYRNRKLIMPSRRRMIQPNDLLLLVGQPSVLKSVYRAIKRELGQFPEPFGSNIYLYIDMDIICKDTIKELVRRSIFIHQKFNHNLIIRVINPNDIDTLQYIKEQADLNVIVDIKYDNIPFDISFFDDIQNYHVGLVIVSKETFKHTKTRNMLYESHVPVLKMANKSFSSVKDAALILSDNRDLEKISTTIYDISEQMGFNIDLYDYQNEHEAYKEQVIEHYYNLSTIFSKNIKVLKENENPIKILSQKDDFIHILPFTFKLTKKRLYSLFSTDSEKLYFKLDDYHQIFIPVQL
ncbi:potassium transporter TrkA [Sulfurimonas lithotrophica]|uniref:Potassium transporter TrkA n=1 Tax=Sulfurimonas lithotrophica TaxID=2590022 RepID=A0A5P8P0T5_9BACT|nr:TrkA C-terminal domain-containing protein [Sulfurimonas lithotrophica]QFR49211.1 potassium transporter TrkA [Sulfurimonas lithotrophica]